MIAKKALKYMVIFLAFVTLITVIVSQGCSAVASQPDTPGQQPSVGQTNSQGRPPRNPDFMNNVLAKVADKLGVSADAVTRAYEDARSSMAPPAPPAAVTNDQSTPPPGTRSWRQGGSENRTAFMSPVFDKMSASLNIPADKISAAWQATMAELRPVNSNNTSSN